MSDEHFTPRTRSMTAADLFRFGPWRFIVPWWIFGLVIALVWTVSPLARMAVLTEPPLLALAGAALAGMTGAIVRAQYVHRPGAGRLLVGSMILCGAAAGWAAAMFLFRAKMARGCDCGPLVATAAPAYVHTFAFLLPAILWLIWCRYVFAGLQGIGGDYNSTRIASFSRQLLRVLPWRGIMALLVVGSAAAAIVWKYRPDPGAEPAVLMKTLARGDAAALALLNDSKVLARIEARRQAMVTGGRERLAALQLDAARPLVHAAACDLVLPGTEREPDLVRAEGAFEQLDNELQYDFAGWQPSAASGRTLLELLPLGDNDSGPRFPFLWTGVTPSALPAAPQAVQDHFEVTYRGETVMDVWLLSLQFAGGARNAAVAIKLLGTSGLDAGLTDVVSRRLGRQPAGAIQIVGAGAMCAEWDDDGIAVRLGPALIAGQQVTPASPVWISFFDQHALEAWRANGGVLDGMLAATHRCAQPQSH